MYQQLKERGGAKYVLFLGAESAGGEIREFLLNGHAKHKRTDGFTFATDNLLSLSYIGK